MLITARSVFAGVAELLLSLPSLITTSNHWYTTSTASASRCANQADSSKTGLHLLAIHAAASHGQQMI